MRSVFADAAYWIALLNPRDNLHDVAKVALAQHGPSQVVTTEMVLAEVFNGLSSHGVAIRKSVCHMMAQLRPRVDVSIIPQTSRQFRDAAQRYESREDKEWSLTDCASFLVMEEKRLEEVLSADHHFERAGFRVLLKR